MKIDAEVIPKRESFKMGRLKMMLPIVLEQDG